MSRQRLESVLPEMAVMPEPVLDGFQGSGVERAPVHAAVNFTRHQSRVFENSDVSGYGGQRHGKRLCQLGDHGRTLYQAGDQRTPGAIAERMKQRIEPILRELSPACRA